MNNLTVTEFNRLIFENGFTMVDKIEFESTWSDVMNLPTADPIKVLAKFEVLDEF